MPPSAATFGCRRPPFRRVFGLKKKKKKKLKEAKDAHKRGRSCPPKEVKDAHKRGRSCPPKEAKVAHFIFLALSWLVGPHIVFVV
jgi:hypothetical protein